MNTTAQASQPKWSLNQIAWEQERIMGINDNARSISLTQNKSQSSLYPTWSETVKSMQWDPTDFNQQEQSTERFVYIYIHNLASRYCTKASLRVTSIPDSKQEIIRLNVSPLFTFCVFILKEIWKSRKAKLIISKLSCRAFTHHVLLPDISYQKLKKILSNFLPNQLTC